MRAFLSVPRVPRRRFLDCLAVVLLLLHSAGVAFAQEPRRLRVGVDVDYPPFEWVDASGQPQGYTVELFREVARSENLEADFHPMSWRDLRAAFNRGEIDVLPGMASSELRMKQFDFSIPHATLIYTILTRNGETRIRSERDLAGMLILAEEGDVLYEYLLGQGLKVKGMGSPREATQRLSEGLGDCAVVPRLMWLHLQKKSGIRNLKMVPSELFPTRYCFAVRKGEERLLAKLNNGLFLAKQSGTLDALYHRHLGTLEAADLPLRVALRRAMPSIVVGGLALGFTALLVWTWALRGAVKAKTAELEATILELEGALAQVKHLSGLIPMCAGCKKIRDDGGYWEAVDDYISRHSEAQFTHGLCPECVEVYFPGFKKAVQDDPGMASG